MPNCPVDLFSLNVLSRQCDSLKRLHSYAFILCVYRRLNLISKELFQGVSSHGHHWKKNVKAEEFLVAF